MSNDQDDGDVGYKRPPRHSQFKPGQSGNPRGRPAGVRNLKADLLDELREDVTICENGREQRVSKQRAVIKTLVAAAIKGNLRATGTLVSFCARALAEQAEVEVPIGSDDLDIVESFVARERRRRRSQPAETQSSEQDQEKHNE
jgi:uncharacterized protein DUF5681